MATESNLATKKCIADALFLSVSWASCYSHQILPPSSPSFLYTTLQPHNVWRKHKNSNNSKYKNLESIFFVQITCEYGEGNVDDDEGDDCRPNRNVFNQFLSQVVEHSCKVDGIDWSNEARSEATQQITAEPHTLWTCRFNLHAVNVLSESLQPSFIW